MTLPIERARTRRPVTWLTLIGILLLPAVVGGILVTALYNPVERLDGLTAAIVNDDEPITIDGQYVPLGRQLTAGLVEGSDDVASNLTWTISNASDAEAGLSEGRYSAVVTIPENFSAAATSTRPGETPERATIEVQTSPDALIVDDAITAQVTEAAASLMGEELTKVYLENVLLGFTTIGEELGDAADGAHQLADGAGQAASGVAQLPGGVTQLADGASGLAGGASQLGSGAHQLANGATGLSDGAEQLRGGLTTIAGATRDAAGGASQLADGVDAGAAQLLADGIVPAELTDLANQTAATAATSASAAADVANGLGGLVAQCADAGAAAEFCDQLAAVAAGAQGSAEAAGGTQTLAEYTAGGLAQFAATVPGELAGQFTAIAANVRALAGGLGELAGGIDQSAAGAGGLASGASQLSQGATGLADGAGSLADGASQLGNGSTELANGASQLAAGVGELADGTGELAGGLTQAVDALPTYSDAEARTLASVVAKPVTTDGVGTTLFGASAIPLLATLALWFGGLASFIALRAVSARTLTSRAPSAMLALRSLAPAAGIGALQGLLVAGVVQLAASYDWGAWFVFAGVSIVAGVAFAAINQAFVAVLGGAGRWVSALVGVLAVATGVVSTVPGVLSQVAGLMPTTPVYNAMLAALGPATGVGASLVGITVWGALSLVATTLVVARRRSTTAQAVLEAVPA